MSKKNETTETAEQVESAQVRNVQVRVVKPGIKLPHSNHRLGKGHVCALTTEEAKLAESLGHIVIIGTI